MVVGLVPEELEEEVKQRVLLLNFVPPEQLVTFSLVDLRPEEVTHGRCRKVQLHGPVFVEVGEQVVGVAAAQIEQLV